jgi:hypothetical protein
MHAEELKEILNYLEEVVCVIDKIGSGFSETEETALALLFYFKKEKIIDKLSFVRKILTNELSKTLNEIEFKEWIEKDMNLWKPPYNKTAKELIEMIKKIK